MNRRAREAELRGVLHLEDGRLRKLDLELDELMEELKEQSAASHGAAVRFRPRQFRKRTVRAAGA